ncbi:PTS sugar transporter subunit IIB [Olegusella massiliensis]|uniref:PTS sugar transporter subunit IIB n=1 Tax=Olegusella massiliensis TaxID=1776381 RepID=UPI0003ADE791|nr:PTS sugar transporter subunit IIB [Olegusella massiliensis]ERL12972.1 PTS system, lactose/cellobiose-specific IIB subunit [Coriobacteriaceae bacterium BV3Ac1]MBS5866037.1 PTS sugar transporter subunit IIB [Coriobacteriaceae bacterium]
MPVPIIVACGSGVATSQTVASKVNRMLKKDNIDAQVTAVDLKSVERHLKDAAAYITIVREKNKTYGVPVIDGIAFLTGINQQKEYEKLLGYIKDYQNAAK